MDPDLMWQWTVKGYVGLHGMIRKWMSQGHKPTPRLYRELVIVRDELN